MKSVYIHIPFCKSICSYCDFCKVYYSSIWCKKYLVKLKEEIMDRYLNDTVKSIYIGGGTPSALNKEELTYLMDMIRLLHISSDYEFTFECNLDDIDEELLSILKSNHVNRLSIGIQSFQENVLKILNRKHTFKEAQEKMKLIRTFGFTNVNLDMIYAVPGETLKDVKKDLKLFLKLKPDHMSTYSLILEKNTMLYLKHFEAIPEEEDANMYHYICKTLERNGFIHYEVSNFAKKGRESIHNLTYWNNEEYYGFGAGAAGYYDKIRYKNTLSLTEYFKGKYHGNQEILSPKDIMDNEIMLGLRKLQGINLKEFESKYQVKIEDIYPVKALIKTKELKIKKGYVFIPKDKIYIMDEILLKML